LVQFISVGVRYSAIIIVLPWFQVGEGTGIPMPSSIGDDGEQVPYPRANFFPDYIGECFRSSTAIDAIALQYFIVSISVFHGEQ
jgi:hypothetical protein